MKPGDRVAVPEGFWKVVLRYYKGSWRAIGFYMANTDISGDISLYVRSVDEIEEMTGMDFFSGPQDTLMVASLILLQRENRPSPMWIPSTHQLTNGMRLINS